MILTGVDKGGMFNPTMSYMYLPENVGTMVSMDRVKSTNLNTLVATIAKIMGIETSPSYEPARPGDIRHSLAGIGRAKSLGTLYIPESSRLS
jgi:hypothetical protein